MMAMRTLKTPNGLLNLKTKQKQNKTRFIQRTYFIGAVFPSTMCSFLGTIEDYISWLDGLGLVSYSLSFLVFLSP